MRASLALLLLAPALLAAQGPEPPPIPVVPAPATTLPARLSPRKTSAGISASDLMTRLYILADDSMMGREAGTIGNLRGTDYIAAEVRRLGLLPAGDDGSFFQAIPLKTRTVDSGSSLSAGGTPIAYGSEWAGRGTASFSRTGIPVVFGGTLGDSAAKPAEDQVSGKLVVYVMAEGGRRLRLGGLAEKATAIAVIAPDQLLGFFRRTSMFVDDPASPGQGGGPPTLVVTRGGAAKLFDAPLDQLTTGQAGKLVDLDLKMLIEPVPFPARNVVAILPGRDPVLRHQYVAIGAHNDHIGLTPRPVDHDSMRIFLHRVRPGGAEDGGRQATPEQQQQVNAELAAWRAKHPGIERQDSISNGADDDGSGSVSVLEIAEQLAGMKQRPKRSVLFVWHVGEEKGLLGSSWFTDHPPVERDSIVAQLNLDMVGRGDAWDVTGKSTDGAVLRGNPGYLQIVGGRRLSTELGDLIEQANTQGKHGMTLDYAMDANGHPMNIYCRSDHYMYARYGIPVAFFTTGVHSDYHQVTDEPEYIDYAHMARVDRLVADVALRVANLDHRVVVDQPKPDPKGGCRQ